MKNVKRGLLAAMLALTLAGCGQSGVPAVDVPGPAVSSEGSGESSASQPPAEASAASPESSAADAPAEASSQADGPVTGEEALAIALQNAGISEEGAYNIKVERDGEHGAPVFEIEFETDYGDYDFSVSEESGRILEADWEVEEEWAASLGNGPVTMEEARSIAAEKVPGSSAEDISIREESDDGRSRFEGNFTWDGVYYEFEIDPDSGVILDWSADYRDR